MLTNNKAMANTSIDNIVGLTMSPQTIDGHLVIMVDQQRKYHLIDMLPQILSLGEQG
jgi:hypothetical protein